MKSRFEDKVYMKQTYLFLKRMLEQANIKDPTLSFKLFKLAIENYK